MNYNQQMETETVPTNSPIRLINIGKTESWKTQAVYHALAERMTESSQDTIVVCQPDSPYLCLGYFQPYDSVFDRDEVEKLKLPVYRRRIGGGATYLDKNQLFYQFIFHHSRVPVSLEKAYKIFLETPVETLKSFGLDCCLRALNEIEVNGKRIAGIGGGRIGDAAVVVGNFLFDFNYDAMSSAWKSPWSGFRELAAEALRERVFTLKQCVPELSISEVSQRLIELFPKLFNRPIVIGELTACELKAARKSNQILTSKDNHEEDGIAIKKNKPLKISADVFIYSKKLILKGKELDIVLRTDKNIVLSVKAKNGIDVDEELLGRKMEDIDKLYKI